MVGRLSGDDKAHRINPPLSGTYNRYVSLYVSFYRELKYFQALLARVQSSLTTKEEDFVTFNKHQWALWLGRGRVRCAFGSLQVFPGLLGQEGGFNAA